eukprot:2218384-Lingulodinium_polyedra.AAC.1
MSVNPLPGGQRREGFLVRPFLGRADGDSPSGRGSGRGPVGDGRCGAQAGFEEAAGSGSQAPD